VPPGSDLVERWRARPDQAGLFVDFDGTLAGIVEDPLEARPWPEALGLLSGLAVRYARVAVVSGRPVDFLAAHLTVPGVVLSGLYGLELWEGGRVVTEPRAEVWRAAVAAAADRAAAELPASVGVERKGLSVTLHVRTAPEHERSVRTWADQAAASSGLVLHRARRSYELRPPVDADKGTAVRTLAQGLSAVCFIGDDLGDLPAFRVLEDLDRAGVTTLRVAVTSDESPPELLATADLLVEGPAGAVTFLKSL